MKKFIKAFARDERGVSAMEYAVLAGIVVLALAGVGTTFKTQVSGMFSTLFSKATVTQTGS